MTLGGWHHQSIGTQAHYQRLRCFIKRHSIYQPPTVKAAEGDKINSSATYAIQAQLAVIELDPNTYDIKVKKYVIAHDAGRVLKREFVDGQLMGGLMHGLALTLYEELMYDDQGNPLTTSLDIYETPTLAEAVGMEVEFIHFETPTKHLVSGLMVLVRVQ